MVFRIGKDLELILTEEAKKRSMSVPMLIKLVVGDWIMELSNERMKRPRGRPSSLASAIDKTVKEDAAKNA